MHTFKFFLDVFDNLLCLQLLLLCLALAIERGSFLLDLTHGIRDCGYLNIDSETRRPGECLDDTPVRWPRVISCGFHGKFNPKLICIGDISLHVLGGMDLRKNLETAELPLQIQ